MQCLNFLRNRCMPTNYLECSIKQVYWHTATLHIKIWCSFQYSSNHCKYRPVNPLILFAQQWNDQINSNCTHCSGSLSARKVSSLCVWKFQFSSCFFYGQLMIWKSLKKRILSFCWIKNHTICKNFLSVLLRIL